MGGWTDDGACEIDFFGPGSIHFVYISLLPPI